MSDIPRSKLTAFKTVLMNGVDNESFDKQNSTLLVSHLILLTSKNWLNLEIINVFIKLINNSSTTGQVISLSHIQYSTHERLKQKSKEWKSNGTECCVIILNVMQLKNGTTQVATLVTKAITVVASKWTSQIKRKYMQIHLAGCYPQILDYLLN